MRQIAVLLSLLLLTGCGMAFAKSEKIETDNFIITYENISLEMARKLAEQVQKAFANITAYLSKKWGQRGR